MAANYQAGPGRPPPTLSYASETFHPRAAAERTLAMSSTLRALSSECASSSRRCESFQQPIARCSKGRIVHARPSVVLQAYSKPRPGSMAAFATACATQLLEPAPSQQRRPRRGELQTQTYSVGSSHYDILGLAQSMCDVTTEEPVLDSTLALLSVQKGGRR